MRSESHKTRISVIREHVTAWRQAEGWSREATALAIVEAHVRSGGPARTGIHFEPGSGDSFTAAKTFADRIFRWLDDETKDTNFLPANFEDSILLAMPVSRRMACVDEQLRLLGLACRSLDGAADVEIDVHAHLCSVIKEDADSHEALANAMAIRSPEALQRAHKEISESIAVQIRTRNALECALSRTGKGD
jgi:hypothetical protein